MKTKNIIIILAAVALCCFASSCVKQNDYDSFKGETDSHLSTVEGQMASLKELTATLGEEHDALKVYVAALGEGFEEYAAEVNALLEDLDRRLDAAEDTIPTFAEMSYVESTFATIRVVYSLSKVAAAIKVKVQSDSTVLADSINKKTAASEKKFMDLFGSYYTSAEIDAKIKVLSDKLDTLFSDMDTAVFAHIETLKTDVSALGTSSAALTDKLNKEVAALKQQDTVFINQIDSLDQAYKDTLGSLNSIVGENAKRIQELESRVTKLEGRVQSVRVVPDYSDGKVNMKKGDTEIKFDVRPVSAAKAMATKGKSVFSFHIIEALATTKASIYTNITIDTVFMSGADSLLVLTIDGTTMPAEFFEETKLYNARLRISDAASGTDCSSSYFPLIKGVTDLSANGSSNCYIVSQAETYKFKAVKGNSDESVGTVSSVSVLWESYGTDETITAGALIKASVSHANGYITFKTGSQFPAKKGNAVIAAKDGSGNILWSWHIWLTDQPTVQTYKNNAGTMMDRNLGATSAEKGKVEALGLIYQWGRKDPFLGADKIYYSVNPNQAASTCTWPSSTPSTASTGTFAYAIQHPMQFIAGNINNNDWYYSTTATTDDTRWQTSDKPKGLYDPCPVGWRVPDGGDSGVWCTAFGRTSSWTTADNWDDNNRGMDFAKTDMTLVSKGQCWYPGAGYRSSNSSHYDVGGSGAYWSCTPVDCSAYSIFTSDLDQVAPSAQRDRASGRSVRCIKK